MPPTNSKSNLQFFIYLPLEIVIDILSRLPIRTIVICKCVCRSWRDLLRTREFADFHFSKSVPGLLVLDEPSDLGGLRSFEVFEFDDELGLQHHDLHYKPVTKIKSMELTEYSELQGSVNGLVLLHRERRGKQRDALYICNPITREYIKLPSDKLVYSYTSVFTFGFGVSKLTGQPKVVRILHERTWRDRRARPLLKFSVSICLVYTLGTGLWRSLALPAPFLYNESSIGVCLNGNLHWLVKVSDVSYCILCLDLETETFSRLCLPSQVSESKRYDLRLVVLGDCLCVSDHVKIEGGIGQDEAGHEIVIWLMKEYGDVKSWTKEFVLRLSHSDYYILECAVVHPIKVFKDGDILMLFKNMCMFYYDKKTQGIEKSELFGYHEFEILRAMKATLHTSSFFSLSSFVNERVRRC